MSEAATRSAPAVVTPARREFVWSVIQAAHAMEERLEAALETAGLSIPKFSVLDQLSLAGGRLAFRDLAERLHCVRSNITQLVDRLEADGLVQRVDDPSDRRSVLAELTPLGVERHTQGAAIMARTESELAASVKEADASHVTRLLGTLR